jgi:hypothetical protein
LNSLTIFSREFSSRNSVGLKMRGPRE